MNSEEINTNNSEEINTDNSAESQEAKLAELKTINQELLSEKEQLQAEVDRYKQLMCSNTNPTNSA